MINVYKQKKYINNSYFDNPLNATTSDFVSSQSSSINYDKFMIKDSGNTGYILDLPFINNSGDTYLNFDNNFNPYIPNLSSETKDTILYFNPSTGKITYGNKPSNNAVWDENGNDIYWNGIGGVGINKTIADVGYKLDVNGEIKSKGINLDGNEINNVSVANLSDLIVGNNVRFTGLYENLGDKILYMNSIDGTITYGDAQYGNFDTVNILDELNVGGGSNLTTLGVSGSVDFASNNIFFNSLSSGTTSQILYYGTNGKLTYGNIPDGKWTVNGNDIEYYDGSVKVSNIKIDDVIDFDSAILNFIGSNTIYFGDAGSLIETDKLKVNSNDIKFTNIDEIQTNKTLYYNQTTGQITYGDAVSGGTIITGGTTYWTQSGNDIYYNDGNVGIGTTNPVKKLDISGDAILNNNGLFLRTNTQELNGAPKYGIGLSNIVSSTNYYTQISDYYGLTFATEDNQRLTITRGGNILINTTTDSGYKLDVNGTERVTGNLTVGGNVGIGTTDINYGKLNISGSIYNDYHYRSVIQSYVGSTTGTVKITLPVGWVSTMMKIRIEGYDYSGDARGRSWAVNVGGYNYINGMWINYYAEIEGAAPFNKVRLAYDGTNVCILLGDTSTTWSYSRIWVTDVMVSRNSITNYGSGWSISTLTSETGISAIVEPVIDFYRDVNGNHFMSNNLTVGGNITATGDVTAYYTSDKRLKTNINQFKATELIEKMNPVIFNWNDKAKELNENKDDRNNFGLIAQDLEKIIPELIHPIYKDYKAIDYVQIISILIQSNKEQQNEINKLKTEMNNLKTEMNKLNK